MPICVDVGAFRGYMVGCEPRTTSNLNASGEISIFNRENITKCNLIVITSQKTVYTIFKLHYKNMYF